MQLKLELEREVYRPLETLRGTATWVLEAPAPLELRLFWYTEGKGTQDVSVIATQSLAAGTLTGRQPFEFVLPDSPYTLHGTLLSICWGVEFLPGGRKEAEIARFILSPWGKPVDLGPAGTSFLPPPRT